MVSVHWLNNGGGWNGWLGVSWTRQPTWGRFGWSFLIGFGKYGVALHAGWSRES